MQLILISGLSGSGKSVALNVLEDSGYYVVDNLPATLLDETVRVLGEAGYDRVAVTVDARSGRSLAEVPEELAGLRAQGFNVKLLFLEAREQTLVRRFSETRRRHPLADGRLTIEDCIAHEHELVAPLADLAYRIDTSDLQPNALRQWVKEFAQIEGASMMLVFESFGYKQGIPRDADLVFDVRCIQNPYYDPILRPLSGRDAPVVEFLERQPEVERMATDIANFLDNWLPNFLRDNRAYLTVAIGCTGGQHRSVYFVERLAKRYRAQYDVTKLPVQIRHRRLDAR